MEEVEARDYPHALPADDEMIERSLPGYAAAWQHAAAHVPAPSPLAATPTISG